MNHSWGVQVRWNNHETGDFMVMAEDAEKAIIKACRFKGVHPGIIIGVNIIEDYEKYKKTISKEGEWNNERPVGK